MKILIFRDINIADKDFIRTKGFNDKRKRKICFQSCSNLYFSIYWI